MQQPNTKPAWTRGLWILPVAIGSVVLAWAALEMRPRSWVLPDGSVVSVARITFGETHSLDYGHRWVSYLAPFLPRPWRSRFHAKSALFKSAGTNDVVVWFQRKWTSRSLGPFGEGFRLTVFDEHGLETPLAADARTLCINATDREITAWTVRNYPHRSRRIDLRIYPGGSQVAPIGEISFRNFTSQKYPVWKSEPLPATNRAEDLSVSLVSLQSIPPLRYSGSASPDDASCTRACFAICQADAPSRDWSVTRIVATSASGERLVSHPGYWAGTEQVAQFPRPLWVDEPAWKLRVELTRAAHFSAGEVWKVAGIPVIRGRQLTGGGAMTNIQMGDLEFLGLSPASATLPLRLVAVDGCWNAHLRTPYPIDDLKFSLVEIRDQAGNVALLKGVKSTTSDGGRGITPREMLYAFGFDLPPGAQTLDLTFAITPIRSVEFMARATLSGQTGPETARAR